MTFAQITYWESLRNIEACFRAQRGKLYHMVIREPVSLNTLADANKVREDAAFSATCTTLLQKRAG